jgi:hypothetical protein
MSAVTDLHAAVKQGDLEALRTLLKVNPRLANARSEPIREERIRFMWLRNSPRRKPPRCCSSTGRTFRSSTWKVRWL